MAENREELKVVVRADTVPFKNGMRAVGSTIAATSTSALRSLKGISTTFGNTMRQVGDQAKQAAKVASIALAGVSIAVGKTGVSYNAMLEQSQIAWTTLLKDQGKATDMLAKLQKMGADTPFEFEGLDKAAKLLNMAGFQGDELFKTLTNVGDAVSAIGGDQETLEGVSTALFQMASKGKISAEEMGQLAERGIPAWKILAKQMGVSVAQVMDLSQKGKLMADDVIPLLVKGMGQDFGGAMDKQSKTMNGMFSTLQDNLKMLMGYLTVPLFEYLKTQLPKIISLVDQFSSFVQKNPKVIEDVFNKLASVIGVVFSVIGNNLQNFYNAILKPLFDFIVNNKETISAVFTSIMNVSQQLAGVLGTVFKQFLEGILLPLFNLIKQNQPSIKTFFDLFLSAAQMVMPILSKVLLGLMQNVVVPLLNFLNNNKQAVQEFFAQFGGFILQAVPILTSILGDLMKSVIIPLLNFLKDNKDTIFKVLTSALLILQSVITTIAPIFQKIIANVQDFIMSIQKGDGVGKIFEDLGNFIKTNIPVVSSIIKDVISVFQAFWDLFGDDIQKALGLAWNIIKNIIQNGLTVIQGIVKLVLGLLTGDTDKASQGLKMIFSGLINFVVTQFKLWVTNIPALIITLISKVIALIVNLEVSLAKAWASIGTTLWTKAKEIGNNVIKGLTGGISELASKVWNTMKNFATDNILKPFKNALGIHSPSRVFAEQGGFIVAGAAQGIDANAKTAISSVQNLASDMENGFNPVLSSGFDLQSSLNNLNGTATAAQQTALKQQQVITLEGDLAKLVDKVKTNVAADVSILASGGLTF